MEVIEDVREEFLRADPAARRRITFAIYGHFCRSSYIPRLVLVNSTFVGGCCVLAMAFLAHHQSSPFGLGYALSAGLLGGISGAVQFKLLNKYVVLKYGPYIQRELGKS